MTHQAGSNQNEGLRAEVGSTTAGHEWHETNMPGLFQEPEPHRIMLVYLLEKWNWVYARTRIHTYRVVHWHW